VIGPEISSKALLNPFEALKDLSIGRMLLRRLLVLLLVDQERRERRG
jgi:hypothetical protein